MVTTAVAAAPIFGPTNGKVSIIVHALAANTQTVQISSTDPTCTVEYEELSAGQSISFEGFDGILYAASSGGAGQIVTIPFVQRDKEEIVKS